MSFLTPLYLLGLAAVSLPLVFHLIRRTPRGRHAFSSLMFLTPSPPRLTRRSRIDNWLLLLLRATALVLLAAAFARPFLRSVARLGPADLAGRKVALLIDTSASMQRSGVWSQVMQHVENVLEDLGPGDDAALYRFGADHEALVRFDDNALPDPAQKVSQIRAAMEALRPGWSASRLGDALVAVADEIDQLAGTTDADVQTLRQIVLISDMQEGSRIDALRNFHWPEDVDLLVHPVEPAAPTNAGIHLAAAVEEERDDGLRVRVANSRDSQLEQFHLHWEDSRGRAVDAEPIRAYSPSGESRVVRVPLPQEDSPADRLVLTGDDHPFDNVLYRLPARREEWHVVYVGDGQGDDEAGLRYYAERAFPDTPRRRVAFHASRSFSAIEPEKLEAAGLVILEPDSVGEEETERLQEFVSGGGALLLVLTEDDSESTIGGILGDPVSLAEVEPDDYAMFGRTEFSHPLFAPFADPRYNDFTKIHFWRYRRVEPQGDWDAMVLARFDNGDPLLVEKQLGSGRIWILAAGWHPEDSDFSRSSKFVPLLAAMLERGKGTTAVLAQYEIGERVRLPARRAASTNPSVRKPDGSTMELTPDATSFDRTDLPGIYTLFLDDLTQQFAVNVPAEESRTARLSVEQLGRLGAAPAGPVTRAERNDKLRQMRDIELENRQKLWQWLIAAALAVLIVETWLAGRLARAAVQPG